ncbi:hypothetical protein GCM10020219_041130 [Nonomuraea dietziae]
MDVDEDIEAIILVGDEVAEAAVLVADQAGIQGVRAVGGGRLESREQHLLVRQLHVRCQLGDGGRALQED